MKVFGIGLSKTGTTSLTEALCLLGYPTIHYPHDETTYSEILNGRFRFSFLDRYSGATDVTVALYYRELDVLYPKSKFILTVRDIPSWLASCERHWKNRQPTPMRMDFNTMIDVAVYGCSRFHAERFEHVYQRHVKDVREYFAHRPQDLLEYNLVGGAGWTPLCTFLNVSCPSTPFPYLHRTAPRR